MELLMCLSCGEFVPAIPDEDSLVPRVDECPSCGGVEFKDNDTGSHVESEGATD